MGLESGEHFFPSVELKINPLVAKGALLLLDCETVDGMVRDATGDPAKYWSTGAIADVCCHVKALATDREMLIEYIHHLQQELAITQARLENKR